MMIIVPKLKKMNFVEKEYINDGFCLHGYTINPVTKGINFYK